MCDDLGAFLERMSGLGVPCGEPSTERWGTITQVTLPGGGSLGVYQPTHPSPTSRRLTLYRAHRNFRAVTVTSRSHLP